MSIKIVLMCLMFAAQSCNVCDGGGLGEGVVYEKKSNYSCSHGF